MLQRALLAPEAETKHWGTILQSGILEVSNRI